MTTEQMEKSFKEIWDLFKATDARLDKRFRETESGIKETYKIARETSEFVRKLELSIERLERLFTSE